MRPRDIFVGALTRRCEPRPATGSATSVVTVDLMERAGAFFPEAHLDAETMARLARAGATVLGFDNVMPLFSVWHESAALGCQVEWGAVEPRLPPSRVAHFDQGTVHGVSHDDLDHSSGVHDGGRSRHVPFVQRERSRYIAAAPPQIRAEAFR